VIGIECDLCWKSEKYVDDRWYVTCDRDTVQDLLITLVYILLKNVVYLFTKAV